MVPTERGFGSRGLEVQMSKSYHVKYIRNKKQINFKKIYVFLDCVLSITFFYNKVLPKNTFFFGQTNNAFELHILVHNTLELCWGEVGNAFYWKNNVFQTFLVPNASTAPAEQYMKLSLNNIQNDENNLQQHDEAIANLEII